MKRLAIYLCVGICTLLMCAGCRQDEGTEPGKDKQPVVSLYTYPAGGAYNPDNDCLVRICTNAAVRDVYYLPELKCDKGARQMTSEDYAKYVIAHGTKVDVGPSSYKDVYITGLRGLYSVTVVGTGSGPTSVQSIEFSGLDYKPYGTGTYTSIFHPKEPMKVNVDYSEVGHRYRIVNLWSEGKSMSFSVNSDNSVSIYPNVVSTGLKNKDSKPYNFINQGSTYDPSTKTFTFNMSLQNMKDFGVLTETLTLDK